MQHHVILVPGFFGFGRLGKIDYFAGVRALLEKRFQELGHSVRVSEVATLPTASLRQRAARVLEALCDAAELPGRLHIVGHSTGGLDVRIAIAPTASLPTTRRFTASDRLGSVVTVCCPHYGTPVATYFTRPLGRALLRAACRYAIFLLERGHVPLRWLLRLGYWAVRLRDPRRRHRGTFDQLYESLLNDLDEKRRTELAQFLRAIAADDTLLFQLTPAGCDLLNACTLEPLVPHGSVVARARVPNFRDWLLSFRSLHEQLVYPLFAYCHRLARRKDAYPLPELSPPHRAALERAWAEGFADSDNDGVVPVASQTWGEIVHVARADHLDVVGQFGNSSESAFTGDWLPSHSGFDAAQFQALWSSVADFILRSSAEQAEGR